MNIYGIVCEYNPFHNGHLYQIEKVKSLGADAIICIMSGNFVQRGDLAIMQKHARAEAAILSGADIVLELPLPFALSSAESFAYGAVSILEKLGVVTHLAFGSETENLDELTEVARLLISGELDSEINKKLELGISYASAREAALSEKDERLSGIIRTPNNILAVEYIKALFCLNSTIKPVAIQRTGCDHDAIEEVENIASASHIRKLISENKATEKLLPKASREIYEREVSHGHAPVSLSGASLSVISALKRLSAEDFKKYADVSEGLENRLFDAISKSASLDDAMELAKTKRYPMSRIRRIFMNAFLDIDASLSKSDVPYVKLLAFSENGRSVLRKARKTSQIEIVTKPAAVKNQSETAKSLLALEKRADDIYSLFMKTPCEQGSALKKSPVFISDK